MSLSWRRRVFVEVLEVVAIEGNVEHAEGKLAVVLGQAA
jgi:hypothetical protein